MIGRIVKGISGFYYVKCDDNVYECKARGLFRKDDIVLAVGDIVEFEIFDKDIGNITRLFDRKNCLVRPYIANLDLLLIVVTAKEPLPNLYNTDKLISIAVNKNIEPVVLINKIDLLRDNSLFDIYSKTGLKVIELSCITKEGIEELNLYIKGKFSAFAGVSGAGKSSLISSIDENYIVEIGSLSEKLRRGKHTTRHTEIFETKEGALIADTPGFSAISFVKNEIIFKENLENTFVEFKEYLGKCKFNGCSHISEKGCAVFDALEKGFISDSRYQSYVSMYNEVRNIKEWEIK